MVFISVTRLQLRSFRFLPVFLWTNSSIVRSVPKTPGFLGGKLLVDAKNAFWTMTTWKDQASMRAFRGSGAHGRSMARLANWCSETAVVHWESENDQLPDWITARQRLINDGRFSPVTYPSEDHIAHRVREPRPRMETKL